MERCFTPASESLPSALEAGPWYNVGFAEQEACGYGRNGAPTHNSPFGGSFPKSGELKPCMDTLLGSDQRGQQEMLSPSNLDPLCCWGASQKLLWTHW